MEHALQHLVVKTQGCIKCSLCGSSLEGPVWPHFSYGCQVVFDDFDNEGIQATNHLCLRAADDILYGVDEGFVVFQNFMWLTPLTSSMTMSILGAPTAWTFQAASLVEMGLAASSASRSAPESVALVSQHFVSPRIVPFTESDML